LHAGVYFSRTFENEDIAVCNVMEQAKHLANIFSFRKKWKTFIVKEATHTHVDIYHRLEEKGMLMANRIEAIWVGAKIEY
jgi:hypothetical protein